MSYVKKLRNKVNENYIYNKIPINIQSQTSAFTSKLRNKVETHRNEQIIHNSNINLFPISLEYELQNKIE